MADQKLTELAADASPTSDDLIYTVHDPAGTPTSKKVTLANAKAFFLATGATDNAILRADGAGGALLQNSASTMNDDGRITTPNDVGGFEFGGGTGNTTTLKTGSDGTFLFDAGADVDIKFKGTAAGASDYGYCDSSFNYVWKSDSSGNVTQSGTLNTHTIPGGTGTLALNTAASDTASGLIELAIQSEQETGTDVVRAVTPGRQHFHPSAAKFWVEASAGNVIETSYNTTSTLDTSTGILVVTIATDFSSVDWACVSCVSSSSSSLILGHQYNAKAAGAITLTTVVEAGSGADPSASSGNASWSLVGFGDHA